MNDPGDSTGDEAHPDGHFTSAQALPVTELNDDQLSDIATATVSPGPVIEATPAANPVDNFTDDLPAAHPTTSTTESPVTIDDATEIDATTDQTDGADPGCGVGPFKYLNADEQSRIVGGTLAVRNAWPFLVRTPST